VMDVLQQTFCPAPTAEDPAREARARA
jgi:hypothetical protein